MNRSDQVQMINLTMNETESLHIPRYLLEQKAPQFLQKNLRGLGEVAYGTKAAAADVIKKQEPGMFFHWLLHGNLPHIEEYQPDKNNWASFSTSLTATLSLFCLAEKFKIVELMDLIMYTCVEMEKFGFHDFLPADQIVRFYEHTSGPCGLRLFAVRDLVYCVQAKGKVPSRFKELDYRIMSRNSELMEDFLRELEADGSPRHPAEYPPYDYYCHANNMGLSAIHEIERASGHVP